jgi:hypothetical protein
MPYPVERVALAAPVSGHLLLDALANLGDHLIGQSDEMEVVDHHLGSGQQSPHRSQISPPRVDRHRLDPCPDLSRMSGEESGDPGARADFDDVDEPTGVQVTEPDRPTLRPVTPPVLIHPHRSHKPTPRSAATEATERPFSPTSMNAHRRAARSTPLEVGSLGESPTMTAPHSPGRDTPADVSARPGPAAPQQTDPGPRSYADPSTRPGSHNQDSPPGRRWSPPRSTVHPPPRPQPSP